MTSRISLAPAPTRVFVVAEPAMIRHGLDAMLATDPGIQRVGAAATGAEAWANAPRLAPQVLLVDMALGREEGAAVVASLRPLLPSARFLMLAEGHETAAYRRAAAAGATGVVLKSASTQELLGAVHAAQRGQRLFSTPKGPAAAAAGATWPLGQDLTPRERELLALMARGLGNQDIATSLAIAVPTVKFHITHVLAKLRAENRTDAVLIALRHGIVGLQ